MAREMVLLTVLLSPLVQRRVDLLEIRPRLARAFGRESAAAAMAEKARFEERRLAERRAEAATIAPRRAPDQPVSSGSGPAGTSAGSPGNA